MKSLLRKAALLQQRFFNWKNVGLSLDFFFGRLWKLCVKDWDGLLRKLIKQLARKKNSLRIYRHLWLFPAESRNIVFIFCNRKEIPVLINLYFLHIKLLQAMVWTPRMTLKWQKIRLQMRTGMVSTIWHHWLVCQAAREKLAVSKKVNQPFLKMDLPSKTTPHLNRTTDQETSSFAPFHMREVNRTWMKKMQQVNHWHQMFPSLNLNL